MSKKNIKPQSGSSKPVSRPESTPIKKGGESKPVGEGRASKDSGGGSFVSGRPPKKR